MSAITPMKVGFPTVVQAVTATSSTVALGNKTVQFLNIHNAGPNPAFVNSGNSSITATFPVVGTGQNGVIIPAGLVCTYAKNNSADTSLASVCGAGLSTTLYIQSGEGV